MNGEVGIDVNDIKVVETDNANTKKTQMANENEGAIASKLAETSDYWTCQRDCAVKIRFQNDSPTETVSVMELVTRAIRKSPNRPALKVERDGQWITWTYKEYLEDIRTTAKAFIQLGLEAYNAVGIIGFNSPEWLFSDLGAIFAGGLTCGIYTTNNPEACLYVCKDAACNILVVENDVQMQKILKVWNELPDLKAIVQYTGEIQDKKPNIYTWNELMEIGRGVDDSVLEKRIHAQSPNKCCTLIYTSGTTGNPKGVMLSHDNLVATADAGIKHQSIDTNDTSFQHQFISYLPLSHIAAQITDIWIPLMTTACVWFARPDALKGSLVDTMRHVRPTLFVGVPRVFEKMEEKLKGIGATVTGFKRTVADWAKAKSLRANQNRETGKPMPYGWRIANRLLRKIHVALGFDRCQIIFTAAAPISKQTLEYYQSINLPLSEIYGMSEATGPVTMCTVGQSRITSIGLMMAIDESKIGNPDEDGSGELCFRGRNVMMGYLNNEEKTRETLEEDGWLRTGDVGRMDQDGFFYITGRIKELIITAGGENIAPVPIEDRIKEEIPLVATAMVIGDKKKFLSCLITCLVEIDQDTGLSTDKLLPVAVQYCAQLGLTVSRSQEIAPDVPEVLRKSIQDGFDRANQRAVSNAAKVQKWKLLPMDFTTTAGELGPTQKLRRPQVMKMYKETIDEFY